MVIRYRDKTIVGSLLNIHLFIVFGILFCGISILLLINILVRLNLSEIFVKSYTMKVIKKYEDGPILIEPDVYKDDRGYFFESFNEEEFKEEVKNS